MNAFLLNKAGLEDLMSRDRATFNPEPNEVYRDIGGNWHQVARDYPAIMYQGRPDTRLHVSDAVLQLLPGEDIQSFLTELKNKFVAAYLVDDTRYTLFHNIDLESNTMAVTGRMLHFGGLVVHFGQEVHGGRG